MRGEFFERTGAYAQARNVPTERLIKLPGSISDQQAAAMMVKGFTASLIINRIFRPKPGEPILYQFPLIRTRAPIGADQWT
jgi:NADPH2:quinone reductase